MGTKSSVLLKNCHYIKSCTNEKILKNTKNIIVGINGLLTSSNNNNNNNNNKKSFFIDHAA